MSDDAYTRPEFWLSDGWETVKLAGWEAPLYWERDSGDETGWRVFTLRGSHGLSCLLDTPVCHISFFEADAFARWRGCRLPTEAEWEFVASQETADWEFAGYGEAASRSGDRRGYRSTLWGLLGMDCQPLHRLSGIQASSRSTGRIQRKIYVRSDDFARGLLRHACGSRARNLSEFFSARNALAIHGSTFGGLNGLCWHGYILCCDKARDRFPSVLDIRRAFVSGRLNLSALANPSCKPEGVSFAAGCGLRDRSLALRLLKMPRMLPAPNERHEQENLPLSGNNQTE